MIEREIKLSFTSVEEARAALEGAGAVRHAPRRLQDDSLYDTSKKMLMAGRSLLRLRRDGARAVVTFKGPVGVSVFHEVNAYDADNGSGGDLVHVDLCLTDTNAFSFMREAGGIERDQQSLQGALTRWTIDMSKADPQIEERPLGPPGDLPRLADADQGRPYNRCWYLSMNPQGGPPMPGGPVGVNFNALMRLEPGKGACR